jgi:hypothetical protein
MPTYFTDEAGNYVPERVRSRARLMVLSDSLDPPKLAERLGLAPDESWCGRMGSGSSPISLNEIEVLFAP